MPKQVAVAALCGAILMVACGGGRQEPAAPSAERPAAAPAATGGGLRSRPVETSTLGTKAVETSQVREVQAILSRYGARQTPSGIILTIPSDVLFDFDKHDVRPDAQAALAEIAKALSHYASSPVRITGHTDSVGDDAYNLDLSVRRAESVKRYLAERLGVDAGRMTTRGAGEMEPVAANALAGGADNPEGRQRNRRVEVVIGNMSK